MWRLKELPAVRNKKFFTEGASRSGCQHQAARPRVDLGPAVPVRYDRPVNSLANQLRDMNQLFSAVILAGGLRPSTLRAQLGISTLCLPVTADEKLLDAWLRSLARTGVCEFVRIVVTDDADAEQISDQLEEAGTGRQEQVVVEVVTEPVAWRGTAGIVRDVSEDLPDEQVVLVAEGACLPPASLDCLLDALEPDTVATVGIGRGEEPAGAYAFRREALEQVPKVGFFDIKEQLLPALYDHNQGAESVVVTDSVLRIRDRASYLQAVFSASGGRPPESGAIHCSASASVSSSALLTGVCVIGAGVIVDDKAVVHNSVVLDDAVIGGGAIISRSIIGTNVEIVAGTLQIDTVVASRKGQMGLDQSKRTGQHLPARPRSLLAGFERDDRGQTQI